MYASHDTILAMFYLFYMVHTNNPLKDVGFLIATHNRTSSHDKLWE